MRYIYVTAFLFFTLSLSTVAAQENTAEQAYNDYLFHLEQYNREHNEYLLAKGQYQQAQTLAAETKARDETAQMLSARDTAMNMYLRAVRMQLLETAGVESSQKDGLSARLEADANWYDTHSDAVASAGSLQDLESDSNEAFSHYEETTVPLVYETLIIVPAAKVSELRRELSVTISDTKTLTSEIRNSASFDGNNADRWMLQIDGKINRSLDKEIEARALLSALQNPRGSTSRNQNYTSTYNAAVNLLSESKQFLKEANEYLTEVIRLVRTKKQ